MKRNLSRDLELFENVGVAGSTRGHALICSTHRLYSSPLCFQLYGLRSPTIRHPPVQSVLASMFFVMKFVIWYAEGVYLGGMYMFNISMGDFEDGLGYKIQAHTFIFSGMRFLCMVVVL